MEKMLKFTDEINELLTERLMKLWQNQYVLVFGHHKINEIRC